jgi:methionyl-tRNA formyltransferase
LNNLKQYTSTNKLRFAVMTNGNVLQKWQVKCLQELLQLDFVEPVLIIQQKQETVKKSFFKKIASYPYPNLLFRIYKRIHKHDWQQAQELPAYLKTIETLECTITKKGKHSEYFSVGDIEKIRSQKPDFILRFGFNIIRGEILEVASYGVWSYHHGDEEKFRGGPPAFWEVHKNEKVCGTILQRLTNKLDGGIVLKKGYFGVTNHSYNTTLANVYNLSACFIKQVCIDLQNGVAHYLHNAPSTTNAKIYTYPRNGAMILFGLNKTGRKINFHWNDLFKSETWKVGILHTDANDANVAKHRITWYSHPAKTSYYADPFLLDENNKRYLLVEDYSYKKGKGVITSIELSSGDTRILIDEPFHLSYPFTFTFDGKSYILPEAHESGKVILYEVNIDQNEVISKHVLLENIHAYDPTLFHYKNKWWLFVTEKETDSNTCLHVFYSENLHSGFVPHANNPVKCNIGSSRPAGSIMQNNGMLIRPSQNCTHTYGGSVVLNKIIVLNEFEFREEKNDELTPDASYGFTKGLHTLNSREGMLVLDVKKFKANWPNFRRKLGKKILFRR